MFKQNNKSQQVPTFLKMGFVEKKTEINVNKATG